MDDLIVKRITLDETRDLEEFYKQAYGDKACFKFPERWDWLFRNNPWNLDDNPHVYIAKNKNGMVLGHNAAICTQCKFFDHQKLIGWSVDSYVLPSYRGLGLGKKLQKINRDDHEVFASISMIDINKHIKIKLGAINGPPVSFFIKSFKPITFKNIKSNNNIPSYSKVSQLLLFTLSYGFIQLLQKKIKSKQRISDYRANEPQIAEFGEADSKIWQKIRERYVFAVERDAKYLNWRYKTTPFIECFCIRIYDNINQLNGLVIYRLAHETNPKVGIVLELLDLTNSHESLELLITAAEKHLLRLGAHQIQMACSDKIINSVIIACGYLKFDQKNIMINSLDQKINQITINSKSLFTKGDQDLDQYPLVEFYSPIRIIWKHIVPHQIREYIYNIKKNKLMNA